MIPWAMNRNVKFTKNFGPSLNPMIPDETNIIQNISISCKLQPLKNAGHLVLFCQRKGNLG